MRSVLLIVLFFGLLSSCKKDKIDLQTEGSLEFSSNEVFFDTVFTGIGSATKRLKVFNPHSKDIKISSISVKLGNSSQFRINVDGESGGTRDYILRAHDSLWVFVEVTVDPGNQNTPFVIEDHIIFNTNGITQRVTLTAWGQDAHYYRPTQRVQGLPPYSEIVEYLGAITDTDLVWTNDKPHVIYGYLLINPPLRLNIEKGTQIHFHEGAGLWIYPGAAIRAVGKRDEPVVFQGDRLEADFAENAGQWDRIWINEGAESYFEHTVIKNGYVGIQAEVFPFESGRPISSEKLILQQTIIKNMVGIGLLAQNFNIDAENLLVSNIGNYNIAINGGGKMDFKHCTFGNYWSGNTRQQPLFFASNYFQDVNGSTQYVDLEAYFGNCIIYGNKDEELEFDTSSTARFDLVFDHCLIKTELSTTRADRYIDCVINPEDGTSSPVFFSPSKGDYRLSSTSGAIEKGEQNITDRMKQPWDLLDRSRNSPPDIGAYTYR